MLAIKCPCGASFLAERGEEKACWQCGAVWTGRESKPAIPFVRY